MRAILASITTIVMSLAVTGCALLEAHEAATSGYVGDTAITARVKTALIKDPHVQASEIVVQTEQGRVTLNGVVDSAAMERRALEIARETPGVRTIDDQLKVATPKLRASARTSATG